jgi:hypothetical protein
VASVSSAGLVTGVSAGTATITVTTQEGAHTATCTVTTTGMIIPSGVTVENVRTENGKQIADMVLFPAPSETPITINGKWNTIFTVKSMDQTGGRLNLAWIVESLPYVRLEFTTTSGGAYMNMIYYENANGDWAQYQPYEDNLYYNITDRGGFDVMSVRQINACSSNDDVPNTLTKVVLKNVPYP